MEQKIEDFFRKVLAPRGFPCLVSLRKSSAPEQKSQESLSFLLNNLETEIERCAYANRDLYFCISTLKQKAIVDSNGKTRVRTGENCFETRALILDIDVDKSGYLKGDQSRIAYRSQEEAQEGLQTFCATINFPEPYIINSGFGLHVYWPFEEAVDSEGWAVLAQQFRSVCAHLDPRLIADPSRVADRTSILRVPQSFSFKGTEPLPVYIVQVAPEPMWPFKFYREHLGHYIRANHLDVTVSVAKQKKHLVSLDIEYGDERVSFNTVYKECNWMNGYMKRRATAPYDEWFAALNIASKCEMTVDAGKTYLGVLQEEKLVVKEEELAKFISRGHAGYNEREVLSKYNESINNKALSARTCDDLKRFNSAACDACPYRDLVKTPLSIPRVSKPVQEVIVSNPVIVAGTQIGTEEVKLPKPPFPYEIGSDGVIYRKIKDESGSRLTAQVIYEYTVIPLGRTRDENTGLEAIEIEARLPHEEPKRFPVPGGVLQDTKTFARLLSDRGIYVMPRLMPEFIEYIIKYTRTIQTATPVVTSYSSYGWKDTINITPKFALYDTIITAEGARQYKNTSANLRRYGSNAVAHGDLEKWKEAFNVYVDVSGMEGHIVNLMLAFGAPLLHFLDQFGVMYNLYGPGGEGKSSSLELATSVWGKPNASHLTVTDTYNSMYVKLGMMNNLPVSFDEITNITPENLSDFVYNLTTGRPKDALTRDRELKEHNLHWQTFVLATSNNSLYGKLKTLSAGNNAHGYRILEFPSPLPSEAVNKKMIGIKETIKENYGIAGQVFMKYVVKNYAEVMMKTRNAMRNLYDSTQSQERFWFATQAVIQVGGYIAKELGLHDYEPGKLIEFMRNEAPREEVRSIKGDAVSKLNEYLLQNLNNTIKVMDDQVTNLELEYKGVPNISVRFEGHKGQMIKGFIPATAIERWCKINATDYTWLRAELVRSGVISRQIKKRIGAGTKYISLVAHCWELDMRHPLVTGHERTAGEERINVVEIAGARA
jgi:hypothetical protein